MKMERGLAMKLACVMFVGSLLIGTAGIASADLQIVEIMFNPSNDDGIYEWIEVRNTGLTDIDLAGAWMDDFDPNTAAIPPNGNATVGPNSENTIVPAGGVAVIYDAFHATGSPANHNDQLFRDSWGLGPEVYLISGDFFPNLNNTSPSSGYTDNIGIWADQAAYEMDVDRQPAEMPPVNATDRVVSVANALVHQYYQTTAPWPSGTSGVSIQWRGVGDISDGANWYKSVNGENGATTNSQISISSGVNSANDVANPGLLPGGTAPTGLRITEIMYNPASSEYSSDPTRNWEWVEVLNNTGALIDFATTPYVIDDVSGANITAANITSGSIPNGGVAVLFHANNAGVTSLTVAEMQAAWGEHANFIPITNASNSDLSLNNTNLTGDTIGIWDSLADYNTDSTGTRVFTNAVVSVDYDNAANGWPDDNNAGSIYLSNLANDPALGASWVLATTSDGLSYSPNQLNGTIVIHPGGDVGSPGTFVVVAPPTQDGDHNGDGFVDAADYVVWRNNPAGFGNEQGYTDWAANFGEGGGGGSLSASDVAVPEPASLTLLLIGIAVLGWRRRSA